MARLGYSSDVSDGEWEIVEPLLPAAKSERGRGRKRTVDLRGLYNAIRYVSRTGCAWDLLPNDFPPPKTVYGYWRKWESAWSMAKNPLGVEGKSEKKGGKKSNSNGGTH